MDERMPEPRLICLRPDQITWDVRLQMREGTDQDAVEDYAELYRGGVAMDPVEAVHDGTTYWGTDGWHREAARELAGERGWAVKDGVWAVTVYDGDFALAELRALMANGKAVVRRKPKDLRKCIRRAVDRFPHKTHRQIAELLRCSGHAVADERSRYAFERLGEGGPLTDGELIERYGVSLDECRRIRDAAAAGAISLETRKSHAQKEKAARSRTPECDEDAPADEQARAAAGRDRRIEKARREGEPPPPVLDRTGRAVPDGVRDVFASRTLEDFLDEVKGLTPSLSVETLCRRAGALVPVYPYLREIQFLEHLRNLAHAQHDAAALAASALACALPHCVCAACDGGGCDECLGSGYLPLHRAPRDE